MNDRFNLTLGVGRRDKRVIIRGEGRDLATLTPSDAVALGALLIKHAASVIAGECDKNPDQNGDEGTE